MRARGRFGVLAIVAAMAGIGTVPVDAQSPPVVGEPDPTYLEEMSDPDGARARAEVSSPIAIDYGDDPEGWEAAAENALAADFWFVSDGDISWRLATTEANLRVQLDAEVEAVGDRNIAVFALDRAERRLEAAQQARAELEVEVENFAITMFVLSDEGNADRIGADRTLARNAQPIQSAAEAVQERIAVAEAELRESERLHAAAVEVLGARQRSLQIRRKARMRAQAIDRDMHQWAADRTATIDARTDLVLNGPQPRVSLTSVSSIVVRHEIEMPEVAAGAQGATAAVTPGAPSPDDETPAVAYTEETVGIAPITVSSSIAGQLRALLGAARSDGIDLHGFGHRTRADQIEVRLNHCGNSGFAIFDMRAGQCSPPSARPGHSQHELGLAVDFTEGGAILSRGSAGFAWLQANAASYGLFNLPSEPWHWSTTGG